MMLSDLIPVRKTIPMSQPLGDATIRRIDSWWVFRGHVFGGKERITRIEHV